MQTLLSHRLGTCANSVIPAAVLLIVAPFAAALAAAPVMKSESFDRDPGWEAHNNRIVPLDVPTIVQDFGYSPATNVAGKAAGEMGGRVTRAAEPAYCADKIGARSLDDKLSASGTFALTKTAGSAGLFFGFFRAAQAGATGRPIASLGMDIDCERGGARLAVRLITGQEKSCGTFVTPFIPGHFRPTPIRNDGSRYHWTLDYDPQANHGNGRITFTIHCGANPPDELLKGNLPEAHRQEALSHFPHTTSFQVDLPEGFKRQDTVFDHFGLMNGLKPGGPLTIYFDDLEYCGRVQDFSQDPHWDGSRNRASYKSDDVRGAQEFGFSKTSHAGGKPGEIGGTFWRTESNWGSYADRVGPLTFQDRLEARGKVVMTAAGPDADMCFGWFRGNSKDSAPDKAGEFLGIHVGGPTRMGHPFLPAICVNPDLRGKIKKGPSLLPGKTYDWSLLYDPNANHGDGAITATLGAESVTLNLKKGQKESAKAARLDHFGLFSTGPGGQMVKLYLDDLQYTAAPVR
jgi:hypothetical protein